MAISLGRILNRYDDHREFQPHVKIPSDAWTALTRDCSPSTQFEHSVSVTADGVEIFTLSQRHGEKPPAAAWNRTTSSLHT